MDDLEFYERRAREELTRAYSAKNNKMREGHLHAAALYMIRIHFLRRHITANDD